MNPLRRLNPAARVLVLASSVLVAQTACSSAPTGGSSTTDARAPGVDVRVDAGVDAHGSTRDGYGADAGLGDADAGRRDTAGTPDGRADTGPKRPLLQVCDDAPEPSGLKTEDWENLQSRAIAALDADHSARDAVTNPATDVTLEGKFTYGPTSKDLQGEKIEYWIDDCSGRYRKLGRAETNGDGRSELTLSASQLPPIGVYDLYLRVVGDNSSTKARLRVLPRKTEFVIFDIDGTLTTGDRQLRRDVVDDLFEPLKSGDYVPKARKKAAEATKLRRRRQGYQVMYLTARPYWLKHRTRQWLDDKNMAPATLRMTRSTAEGLPTNSGAGEYKKRELEHLKSEGFELVAAYGNSDTDVWAFEKAGIDKSRTYTTGESAGKNGTVDLGDDYARHVRRLKKNGRPADQPFREH
ncbi:MAG: HAD family acid phosphatase [Bradymonadaceae bacterium]